MKISARTGSRILEVEVERHDGHYLVRVDGVEQRVDAFKLEGDFYSFLTDGRSYEVSVEARRDHYRVRHGAAEQEVVISDAGRRAREEQRAAEGPAEVRTQMPGKVVRVLVQAGETVEAGQGVVVVEAMKMENEIAAPKAGRIRSVDVEPGQAVEGGARLVVVE